MRKWRSSRTLSVAALVLALGWVYLLQVHPLLTDTEKQLHGNDFWHLYLAGKCVRTGDDFYDFDTIQRCREEAGIKRGINPFVYLPFTAVMFAPFSLLPPETAMFVWFGMNLGFLGISVFFLSRGLPEGRRLLAAVFLLLLSGIFFPLRRSLTAGQLNLILLLLISLAVHALSRRRWFWAGVWTGVAAMIKVSPFFLLLFLAWKRKWNAVLGGAVAIALLMVVTFAVMGPSYALRAHAAAIPVFRQMGYGSSTWYEHGQRFHVDPGNVSPASVVYRLLVGDPGIPERFDGDPLARPPIIGIAELPRVAKAICIGLAAVVIGLLGWVTRRPKDENLISLEYSCAVIAMLLVPSLLWDHYLVLLFPAAMFLFVAAWTRNGFLFTVLWSLPLAFMSIPYLFGNPAYWNGWKVLLMAPQAFALLVFYGTALWAVRDEGSQGESGGISAVDTASKEAPISREEDRCP